MNILKKLVTGVSCLVVVFSTAVSAEGSGSTPRIVGGTIVPDRAYPWIVALEDDSGFQFCAGTLISKKKILTAAHCSFFYDQFNKRRKIPARFLRVRVGSNERGIGGQLFKVSRLVPHRKYDDVTFDYDVAIWTIKTPKSNRLVLSDEVNIVKLPEACEDSVGNTVLDCKTGAADPDTSVVVAGWGTTVFDGLDLSPDLLDVSIPVISNSACSNAYGVDGPITERMICAGATDKDSCQGDSGGPLFAYLPEARTGLQTGIVSWGIGCGWPDYYGVYTRISNPEIRAFIRKKARI